jgi:hypothetical protein
MLADAKQRSKRMTLMRLIAVVLIFVAAPVVSVAQTQQSLAPPDQSPIGTPLPADSVLLSLLSFAVGVGACLLVVSQMLPALVRSHCAEIVRDYMEFVHMDSDVRVVVIDRESISGGAPHGVAPRRRAAVQASESDTSQLRVDRAGPQTVPAPSGAEMQSVLSHIYEQNVQLRNQLRSQSADSRSS